MTKCKGSSFTHCWRRTMSYLAVNVSLHPHSSPSPTRPSLEKNDLWSSWAPTRGTVVRPWLLAPIVATSNNKVLDWWNKHNLKDRSSVIEEIELYFGDNLLGRRNEAHSMSATNRQSWENHSHHEGSKFFSHLRWLGCSTRGLLCISNDGRAYFHALSIQQRSDPSGLALIGDAVGYRDDPRTSRQTNPNRSTSFSCAYPNRLILHRDEIKDQII